MDDWVGSESDGSFKGGFGVMDDGEGARRRGIFGGTRPRIPSQSRVIDPSVVGLANEEKETSS